ncbi:MAG: TonB-dependent receptor domain-containing protein [Alphaproteobacteria bacterium]
MRNSLKGARALCALILASGIGAANAQQTGGETTETVVVTGSRIPVSPLQRDQPLILLDADTMLKTGLTSTADILQSLPLAGGGLNAKFNNSGNFGNPPDGGGVGAGAAEIDLRYLGSRRVLVLVDGLRWVPGSSASGVPGSVDLNTIPPEMISRIEVLQEGASPIYGSDAIAGVVNIITRQHQEGMDASAEWGQYGEDDGDLTHIKGSWGSTEGRTSIVVGAGYFNQDGVFAGDRDISRFPAPYANSCLAGGCSSGTPLGRFVIVDPINGFQSITLKQAFPPGVVPFYDSSDPTGPNSDFKSFTTLDRFNFQPFNFVVTPSERVSMFGQVRHELTDWLYVRLRTSYVNRKSVNQAAPLPLFVGPDAGNGNLLDTVVIDVTNPFNPFGFTLGPGSLVFVGRRLVENGPRHYEQDVHTWNITGTIGGELDVGDRTWLWDVNAVWSRNHASQIFTGNVNAANVAQALGPVALCTGACVPLNLFGGAGSITDEMLDFIAFTQQDSSEQTLRDYTANLAGDLFDLPAGPVGFAVGYEHRENEGFFEPDPIVAAGLSSDIPAKPASGSIDVDEFYAELKVPLLADQPFFHKLDVTVAGRWFDYSTSGWDSTYKVGGLWRPVEEVLLRGSWGQAFRAPSIGELFGTASRFDQEVTDPCSDMLGLSGGPVAPPNVQANCIANGVPADGSYVQLNPQLPVFTSGNPSLVPETSEAWTFGAVWEPSFMKNADWASGGSIEVVYTDLELDGAIQAQNAASLLERCAQTGDPLSCSTITRTSSGAVSGISNPLTNIGGIKTEAIDVNLLYYSPEWSLGQFAARWYTTFLLNFDEIVPISDGFTTISREGTERGSPDQAWPRVKSNFALDWDLENWGATIGVRYISSVKESQVSNTLDETTYVDAQLRWTPPVYEDRFLLAIGVTNAFDEDPPGCISCGLNNFDPNAYDPPGRFFYVRLNYKE